MRKPDELRDEVEALQGVGFDQWQSKLLAVLMKNGCKTRTEIAEAAGIDKPAVTLAAKPLLDLKLIRATPRSDHRKGRPHVAYCLTDEPEEIKRKLMDNAKMVVEAL